MTEAEMAAVAKMVTDAVAKMGKAPARKSFKAKGRTRANAKPTPEVTAARKAANDAECIKVFTAAGYKDVQPRINVKVYGRIKPDGSITGWLKDGRRVKRGEKSHQVGPFALFHVDQTEVDGAKPEAVAAVEAPKAEATEVKSSSAFHWND